MNWVSVPFSPLSPTPSDLRSHFHGYFQPIWSKNVPVTVQAFCGFCWKPCYQHLLVLLKCLTREFLFWQLILLTSDIFIYELYRHLANYIFPFCFCCQGAQSQSSYSHCVGPFKKISENSSFTLSLFCQDRVLFCFIFLLLACGSYPVLKIISLQGHLGSSPVLKGIPRRYLKTIPNL